MLSLCRVLGSAALIDAINTAKAEKSKPTLIKVENCDWSKTIVQYVSGHYSVRHLTVLSSRQMHTIP